MSEQELEGIVNELNIAITECTLPKSFQTNPRLTLPLRLSLDMSQKSFLEHINNLISQPTLIKYESGKGKKMPSKIAASLSKYCTKRVELDIVLKNFRKFSGMKTGKHMTSEKARNLQCIWMKKTSKKQREAWGRKGASVTNRKQVH